MSQFENIESLSFHKQSSTATLIVFYVYVGQQIYLPKSEAQTQAPWNGGFLTPIFYFKSVENLASSLVSILVWSIYLHIGHFDC